MTGAKMTRLICIPVLMFCVLFGILATPDISKAHPLAQETRVLGVGHELTVTIPSSEQITVINGQNLRVEDLGSRVRLIGKRQGVSTISSSKRLMLVRVLSASQFATYLKLQKSLEAMKGLQLEVDEDRIVVTGRLLRWTDWQTLSRQVSAQDNYQFFAVPDQTIDQAVRDELSKLIQSANLPVPDFSFGPARIQVSSDKAGRIPRYQSALQPFGFQVEKSDGALALEPLVRVQILVTELRKSSLRKLGVSWPGSYNAQLVPSFIPPGHANSPLNLQIHALEDQGEGRVLASPNLLARSGAEAEFLAGGEFPIRVSGHRRQDVVWKRYGVLLKIKPIADFAGRMSIGITTEISTIDASRTVDGIPGLLSHRIESHFDLKESRTIALSGLIRQDSGKSQSGLPGLGRLPILGPLFSSRDFIDERTELVVFVTPEVINEHSEVSK